MTRFDRVRKRLLWAKKIWIGKGLIGRESSNNAMRQIIEFYRSNQWQNKGTFGDLPNDVLRVVNKIFPIANRQQAGIAARNPRAQYFPRVEESRTSARHIESLHNYDIREQNHIYDLNASLRFAQFAPFPGITRHGFTPEAEIRDDKGLLISFESRAHPNRPWIKASAPWNTLIDPRAESFDRNGGATWCAFRSVMTVDQIKRNPNMKNREALKDFRGNISGPWQEMVPEELLAREDPDAGGYVEVWSVYDLEDRTWYQLTLDGVDNWLREPADWPIPWEWLPFNALIVNPQVDTPFPKAMLEGLLPYQIELNQVRTMMSILARQIRRIVIPGHTVDHVRVADVALAEHREAGAGNRGGLGEPFGVANVGAIDRRGEQREIQIVTAVQRQRLDFRRGDAFSDLGAREIDHGCLRGHGHGFFDAGNRQRQREVERIADCEIDLA
jgi:hypothetical protein